MSAVGWVARILLVLACLQAGCAMSPEQREATQKAWAARDLERSEECAQSGGRYWAGGCLYGTAQ